VEKLIYLLWKKPGLATAEWRDEMRTVAGSALIGLGAQRVQFNCADDAVAAGDALRIISREPPDGLLLFWLPTANIRDRCEALLREHAEKIAGYLVTESCIKSGVDHCVTGERTAGFSLIGFLQRPARLSEKEWLHWWLGCHTQVAVDTQSTFRYVQNVVTRTLTDDAPALDALVEEGFPAAALTSPHAFYDAVGDEQKYQRNLQLMMDSCHRFIDFDRIDSMPMSEYFVGKQEK
jgi:hypothetical protein